MRGRFRLGLEMSFVKPSGLDINPLCAESSLGCAFRQCFGVIRLSKRMLAERPTLRKLCLKVRLGLAWKV